MNIKSTLAGQLVTVFGGSGYIGRYVAKNLLARGAILRIASRDPQQANTLEPLADLKQLHFFECDITNKESVAAALQNANYAINLVGAFEGNLTKLMGEAPGCMAKVAQENGALGFVHVSAIGPDANSSAEYARGKALGETRVLEGFPNATILRPSIVFGPDDNFLNMFGQMIKLAPALPVFGPNAKLQLVYAEDVAEAVAVSLENPDQHGGAIYELGGPDQLSMLEINQRIALAQGRKRAFLPMPDALSALFAAMPLTPMSRDQWTLLKPGSTVSGAHRTFADLGIEPRALSEFLDHWMRRFAKRTSGTSNSQSSNEAAT